MKRSILLRPSLAVAIVMMVSSAVGRANEADGRFDIYWNDTEGGAATLVVTPAGESILFDTGNPGGRDAKRIFETATKVAGLKRIDYLVTTHFHIDHFGGAADLSKLMPIKVVYDNGEFKGGFERPSKEYLAFDTERRVISPGDLLPLKQREGAPPVTVRCLGAQASVRLAAAGRAAKPGGRRPQEEARRRDRQRQQRRLPAVVRPLPVL